MGRLGDFGLSVLDSIWLEEKNILFVLLGRVGLESKVKGFFNKILGKNDPQAMKKEVFGKLVAFR